MKQNEMQNFTTLIVNMVKQENLFASQGGPIILAQVINRSMDQINQFRSSIFLNGDFSGFYIRLRTSMEM